MKKILALIPTLFLLINLNGQSTANLTISTTGNSNLKITFANKKYSLQDRTATFQFLKPGIYPLTIFQLRKKAGGASEYVVVYDKNITLTSQRHLEICVMRFGKVTVDENMIDRDDWNDSYTNPPGSSDQGHGQGNDPGEIVTQERFATIKNAISGEFSDDDKLRTGKVVLKNNLFSSAQLKNLCTLFFNDDYKLSFAKFAYDYCHDKGNYFTVAETFFSNSNKRELLDYIGNR